jgi:hypothetical protein
MKCDGEAVWPSTVAVRLSSSFLAPRYYERQQIFQAINAYHKILSIKITEL